MKRTGIHHLGLATLDIDKTVDFWTNKLGCEVVLYDLVETPGGGRIKHVFMDTGDGSLVAFLCPERLPELPLSIAWLLPSTHFGPERRRPARILLRHCKSCPTSFRKRSRPTAGR